MNTGFESPLDVKIQEERLQRIRDSEPIEKVDIIDITPDHRFTVVRLLVETDDGQRILPCDKCRDKSGLAYVDHNDVSCAFCGFIWYDHIFDDEFYN